MKKITSFLFAAIVAISFTSCGTTAEYTRKVMYDSKSEVSRLANKEKNFQQSDYTVYFIASGVEETKDRVKSIRIYKETKSTTKSFSISASSDVSYNIYVPVSSENFEFGSIYKPVVKDGKTIIESYNLKKGTMKQNKNNWEWTRSYLFGSLVLRFTFNTEQIVEKTYTQDELMIELYDNFGKKLSSSDAGTVSLKVVKMPSGVFKAILNASSVDGTMKIINSPMWIKI